VVRSRSVRLLAGVTFCGVAGLASALFAFPAAAGSSHLSGATITVTAGKPTEASLQLSKRSLIPAGTVIFDVWNKGMASHSFKLCSTPTTAASAKSCKGKSTPTIKPGKKGTLTVTLAKGSYEYQSGTTDGLIGIAVKAGASATPVSTSPNMPVSSTPAPTTTTTPVVATPPAGAATTTGCFIDGTAC
jgi:hypothetical protein